MKVEKKAAIIKGASRKSRTWADNLVSKKRGITRATYEIVKGEDIHSVSIPIRFEKEFENIKWSLGERNVKDKNGKQISRKEYWMVSKKLDGSRRHKNATYLQRMVKAEELKAKQMEDENINWHVHHKNFNTDDNTDENLVVITDLENMRIKNDEKHLRFSDDTELHTLTYHIKGKSRSIAKMIYAKRILAIGILDNLILGHNTRIKQAAALNKIDIVDLKSDLNILLYEIGIGDISKASKKRFHHRYKINHDLLDRIFSVYEEFVS